MMVLISRLDGVGMYRLTTLNWDIIVVLALLVAQKSWDDVPLNNIEFIKLLGVVKRVTGTMRYDDVDIRELNRLEKCFLAALHYDVYVRRRAYAEFYYELCSIHRIAGEGLGDMPLEPLTVEQARRLGISQGRIASVVEHGVEGDRPPITKDDMMLEVDSHPRGSVDGASTAAWPRQGTRGFAVIN